MRWLRPLWKNRNKILQIRKVLASIKTNLLVYIARYSQKTIVKEKA